MSQNRKIMEATTALTEAQVNYLINFVMKDITNWLMEDYGYTIDEALGTVYNSLFYEKLKDLSTGLYVKSSCYNYELLRNEMKYGKIA